MLLEDIIYRSVDWKVQGALYDRFPWQWSLFFVIGMHLSRNCLLYQMMMSQGIDSTAIVRYAIPLFATQKMPDMVSDHCWFWDWEKGANVRLWLCSWDFMQQQESKKTYSTWKGHASSGPLVRTCNSTPANLVASTGCPVLARSVVICKKPFWRNPLNTFMLLLLFPLDCSRETLPEDMLAMSDFPTHFVPQVENGKASVMSSSTPDSTQDLKALGSFLMA